MSSSSGVPVLFSAFRVWADAAVVKKLEQWSQPSANGWLAGCWFVLLDVSVSPFSFPLLTPLRDERRPWEGGAELEFH